MKNAMTARQIIDRLGLEPHPEGGYYRETFRDKSGQGAGNRAYSSAIYYLLDKGQNSHWHRVDAAEIWHYYAGAPLALTLWDEAGGLQVSRLGPDILKGQHPQVVVPSMVWQSAEAIQGWTLVGCTVAPGFEFSGFEMAPDLWSPGETDVGC